MMNLTNIIAHYKHRFTGKYNLTQEQQHALDATFVIRLAMARSSFIVRTVNTSKRNIPPAATAVVIDARTTSRLSG